MFNLSSEAFSLLTEKFSKEISKLEKFKWEVDILCCGCSGDCGSNWMRS
ncbi:MAG: hypothetical protein LUF90_06955 [Rikenellaceae bacterium]|nr:hypothetical protein [Rikenellaceae bacterium]